jgi:hypothetical protein
MYNNGSFLTALLGCLTVTLVIQLDPNADGLWVFLLVYNDRSKPSANYKKGSMSFIGRKKKKTSNFFCM